MAETLPEELPQGIRDLYLYGDDEYNHELEFRVGGEAFAVDPANLRAQIRTSRGATGVLVATFSFTQADSVARPDLVMMSLTQAEVRAFGGTRTSRQAVWDLEHLGLKRTLITGAVYWTNDVARPAAP